MQTDPEHEQDDAEPTTAAKLRSLPWDIGFSAANSVFVQFTYYGSAFVLFQSELGLSKAGKLHLKAIFWTVLAMLFFVQEKESASEPCGCGTDG